MTSDLTSFFLGLIVAGVTILIADVLNAQQFAREAKHFRELYEEAESDNLELQQQLTVLRAEIVAPNFPQFINHRQE